MSRGVGGIDLRHAFWTMAVQAFPLSDVKAYLGHADISTTMIYVHHVPRREAADKLSKLIGGASELGRGFGRDNGCFVRTEADLDAIWGHERTPADTDFPDS